MIFKRKIKKIYFIIKNTEAVIKYDLLQLSVFV